MNSTNESLQESEKHKNTELTLDKGERLNFDKVTSIGISEFTIDLLE